MKIRHGTVTYTPEVQHAVVVLPSGFFYGFINRVEIRALTRLSSGFFMKNIEKEREVEKMRVLANLIIDHFLSNKKGLSLKSSVKSRKINLDPYSNHGTPRK